MTNTTTTTTTIKPTLISSPNPSKHQFTDRFLIKFPTRTKPLSSKPCRRSVAVKCTNLPNSSELLENPTLRKLLSGMVDEGVKELLNKEENRAMLDGLEKAEQRVERVKRELAELEQQENEVKKMKAYITQLESRATEIEECQKEILKARALVEEAERALNPGGVGDIDAISEKERKAIIKNEERLESIKAASISAIVGTLAGLPFSLAQVTSSSQLILPSAVTFIGCALFGVTFRYIIRRDLDDIHLKTGGAAAFGIVKGLATLEGGPPLELETSSLLSHAFTGAINVSENLLIFLFAAAGLEYCIKLRILSPFPIERPVLNRME